LRLAKDHFSYIGIHREALDEVQQLKNELWKIVIHPESENSVKIAAVKELHNVVKTKCLLLRDLPFITRISKYYDISMLDDSSSNSNKLSPTSTNFRDNKSSDNQSSYKNSIMDSSHLTDTINSHNNYDDDDVMTLMQAQIPKQDTLDGKNLEAMTDEDIDKLITPEQWETIRKLKELRD
jgi:hypothetical protein